MPRMRVTLDHAAIRRMLSAQFAPFVDAKAEEVRAVAQADLTAIYPDKGYVVDTQGRVTDRRRDTVAITEAAGARIEAKYGVLQDAAERSGLTVKRRD